MESPVDKPRKGQKKTISPPRKGAADKVGSPELKCKFNKKG